MPWNVLTVNITLHYYPAFLSVDGKKYPQFLTVDG